MMSLKPQSAPWLSSPFAKGRPAPLPGIQEERPFIGGRRNTKASASGQQQQHSEYGNFRAASTLAKTTRGPFATRTTTVMTSAAPSTAATTTNAMMHTAGFKPRPGSVIETVAGQRKVRAEVGRPELLSQFSSIHSNILAL